MTSLQTDCDVRPTYYPMDIYTGDSRNTRFCISAIFFLYDHVHLIISSPLPRRPSELRAQFHRLAPPF